jgi:hypothetical protein
MHSVAVLALLSATMMLLYRRVPMPEPDSSVYATVASNLLAGRGYAFNFQPHIYYPPGLPFLYAAAGFVFGLTYPVRMMVTGVSGFLALMMSYLLLRRRGSETLALGLTLLFGTGGAYFTIVTSAATSEVPYCALSLLCLYLGDRIAADRWQGWSPVLLVAGLTAALPLAVLTRSVGLALLPALGLSLLLQARRLELARSGRILAMAVPLAAGLSAFAGWTYWAGHHRPPLYDGEYSDRYVDQLAMKDFRDPLAGAATAADFGSRLADNCGCAGAAVTQLTLSYGWIEPAPWSPAVAAPILLILVGFAHFVRRSGGRVADWYTLFYLVIVMLWFLCADGRRFLLPIFPLLLFYMAAGGSRLMALLRSRPARFARLLAILGAMELAIAGGALVGRQGRPSLQHLAALGFWAVVLAGGWRLGRIATREGSPAASKLRTWRTAGGLALALFILASYAGRTTEAARVMRRDHVGGLHYHAVLSATWIRENTPPDAVVMADGAAILHPISQRRVVEMPATRELDRIEAILQKRRVQYLVVSERQEFRQPDSRTIAALLRQSRRFVPALMAHGQTYSVYRLDRSK